MKTITRLRWLLENAYIYNKYAKSIKPARYYGVKRRNIKEAIRLIDTTKTSKAKYVITNDVVYHGVSCVKFVFKLTGSKVKYAFHVPTGTYKKYFMKGK